MKLHLISEAAISEVRDHDQDDKTAQEMAVKNMVYQSLTKIRNMLKPMGLTKGKSSEPIHDPDVLQAWQKLRWLVQTLAKRDANRITSGLVKETNPIASFWGFSLPEKWTDVHNTQYGKPNVQGVFDDLIRTAIESSVITQDGEVIDYQPIEVRVQALVKLAEDIWTWGKGF